MDLNSILKKEFSSFEIIYDDGDIFSFVVPAHLPLTMQGWGNGYVGIRNVKHPWFNKRYNHIKVNIHGGLTYGEVLSGIQVFGFDTAHYRDNITMWPKYKLLIELTNLVDQAKKQNV